MPATNQTELLGLILMNVFFKVIYLYSKEFNNTLQKSILVKS